MTNVVSIFRELDGLKERDQVQPAAPLSPGDVVLISRYSESFWVKIVAAGGGRIYGRLEFGVIYDDGFNLNDDLAADDLVEFEERFVLRTAELS